MRHRISCFLLLLAAAAALNAPRALHAQTVRMRAADGAEVLRLDGGHLLILRESGGTVVVESLLREDGQAAALDVRKGDRLRAVDGAAVATLRDAVQAYQRVATGQLLSLSLLRGADARVVRVAKPAPLPDGQRTLAIKSDGAAAAAGGAGAWTTAGSGAAATVSIAGAQVGENDQGMPAVTHRTAHPAASAVALRVGDVVTAVNGRSLAALAGLVKLYGDIAVGQEVVLTIRRGSEELQLRFLKPEDK